MIQRTEHRVAVPFLPEALRGLRVVQLSDLHRSNLTPDRLLRQAVAMANAAEPDIIALTGDFVTKDSEDIAPCAHIVSALCARLGVYAVLGNHDHYTDAYAIERALAHAGIQVLINHNVRLESGLRLVGLDDERTGRPDAERALAGIGPREPVLALIHNPSGAERLADRPCVALCGHTHGGQIRVPILTARHIRRIGAKRYRAGWFQVGQTRFYVNRGLGRVGIPLRLFCRPEMAVFTLEPECLGKG